MLEGPQCQPCREWRREHGHACQHSSAALMFVKAAQFIDACRAISGIELPPFQIIITEELKYLLEEALATMPCRERPREKRGMREALEVPVHSDASDVEG